MTAGDLLIAVVNSIQTSSAKPFRNTYPVTRVTGSSYELGYVDCSERGLIRAIDWTLSLFTAASASYCACARRRVVEVSARRCQLVTDDVD